MKEIRVSRKVAILGLIAFLVLLIAVGFLAYKYFLGNFNISSSSVLSKTESFQPLSGYSEVSPKPEISRASQVISEVPVLSLEEFKIVEDEGSLRAVGSVKNIGEEPIEGFVIVLRLISPTGNILKTEKSESESAKIMPGDSYSFNLVFVPPPGPESTEKCKISFEKKTGEEIKIQGENSVVSIEGLATGPWMLSEKEINEAIQVGKSIKPDWDSYHKFLEDNNYIYYAEGTIAPKSEIIVFTPYSYVLTKAWQSQRNYEEYSLEEAKKDALKVYNNFPLTISFLVTVYGASIDFAQSLKAVIINPDGSAVHPIDEDVPSIARFSSESSIFPYVAGCFWVFDSMELGDRKSVTFVLIRELGEQRAVIDFSKFK